MDANIVDIYYQRKKDNVTEYTKILMKNALDKKYMNVKLFQDIIEEFMDDDLKNKIQVTYKVNKFIHENNIIDLKLRRIINYTINFIDNDKVVSDIYDNNEYIILISKIILLSLEINKKVNVLANSKIRYSNILTNVLEENVDVFEKEFLDKVKYVEDELNEKIKENVLDDKNFFKIIDGDKFHLNFIQIKPDFYDAILVYDIKALKKYLISDIEEQIKVKKLNFDFTIITAELLSVYILKLLLIEKKKSNFIIKLPENFITNSEFLEELVEKFNNPKIKMRVCLNIDYRSFIKNNDIVENLKKSGFRIAIYDMNKLNHNTYLFKDTVDYIFLNNNLKENSSDLMDFCKNNDLIVIDDTVDIKEHIKESYLLKH